MDGTKVYYYNNVFLKINPVLVLKRVIVVRMKRNIRKVKVKEIMAEAF